MLKLRHLLLVALLAACTPDLRLPPGARVTCTSESDCPSGFLCKPNIATCVPVDNDDQTPPLATVVTLGPSPVTAGATVAIAFTVDEPLARDPVVTLGGLLVAPVSPGALSFTHVVDGRLAEGPSAVTVRLIDRVGNEAVQTLGEVVVDTVPPKIHSLSWLREGRTAVAETDTVAYEGRADGDAVVIEAHLVDQEGTRLAPLPSPTLTLDSASGLQAIEGVAALDGLDLGAATAVAVEVVLADALGNRTQAWASRSDALEIDRDWPTDLDVHVLGPAVTTSQVVTLAPFAIGATELFVEGDVIDDEGTFVWRPYVSALEVTLSPVNGDKKVQVRFRDGAHHEAGPVEAHVTLQLAAVDTSAPDLLEPANGALAPGRKATLRWTPRSGAASYRLEVLDARTQQVVLDESTAGASRVVDFPDARTYTWRVTSNVQVGASREATVEALGDRVFVYCDAGPGAPCVGGGAGNVTNPHRTVGGALALAAALGLSRVDVAARQGGAAYEETVVLGSDISIYGGFDPDFTTDTLETRIRGPGLVTVLAQALTAPVVLDRLTIEGPPNAAGDSLAMFVRDAGPSFTIRRCTVTGGLSAGTSFGVFVSGSSPDQATSIEDSSLSGGSGALSMGLAIQGGTVDLRGSDVAGGLGVDASLGARIQGGAKVVISDCPSIAGKPRTTDGRGQGMAVSSSEVTVSGNTLIQGEGYDATGLELTDGIFSMTGGVVSAVGNSELAAIAIFGGQHSLKATTVTVSDVTRGSVSLVGIAVQPAAANVSTAVNLEGVQVTVGKTAHTAGGSSTGVSMDAWPGTLAIVDSTVTSGSSGSSRAVLATSGTTTIARSTLVSAAAGSSAGLAVQGSPEVTLASSVVLPGQSPKSSGVWLEVNAGSSAVVRVHNSTLFSGTTSSSLDSAAAVRSVVPGDAPVTLELVNNALLLQAATPSSACVVTSDLNSGYRGSHHKPKWVRSNAWIGCAGAFLLPDSDDPPAVTAEADLNDAWAMTQGFGAAAGNFALTLAAAGLDAQGKPTVAAAPLCAAGLPTTNPVCGDGTQACGPTDPDRAGVTRACPDSDPSDGSYDCFSIGAYECP